MPLYIVKLEWALRKLSLRELQRKLPFVLQLRGTRN